MLYSSYGCSPGKAVSTNVNGPAEPGYEIVIRFYEYGNTIGGIMDVLFHNNMFIMHTERMPFANDKYEIRIKVKHVHSRQLSYAENELRKLMNVMSVTIERN